MDASAQYGAKMEAIQAKKDGVSKEIFVEDIKKVSAVKVMELMQQLKGLEQDMDSLIITENDVLDIN